MNPLQSRHPSATISSLAERHEFLDWNLLYLFTFDIELDIARQERVGRFSGGVRLTLPRGEATWARRKRSTVP